MTTQPHTPNPPPDRPKKGKDKKIFSCHSCRRRKLKCDRFDPCGACQVRGEGDRCTWEEGQRPERHHCESLEKLPKMISNLGKEVQELKLLNSSLMEKFHGKGGDGVAETLALMTPDLRPPSNGGISCDSNSRWGLQLSDIHQWTSYQLMALLPASPLLWGLVSHYIFSSASLTGFIDIHQIIGDVEEVEHLRQGFDMCQAPKTLKVKLSRILACASLAAVDLDPDKAQELGIEVSEIDALVRDLYRKARMLITPADGDTVPTTSSSNTTSTLARNAIHNSLDEPSNNGVMSRTPPPTRYDPTLLGVVSIKILLLLTARSFATPSEYLKLHLDAISSAVDASLDSAGSAGMSPAKNEWCWQLWSTLCVMDWTSPGIYHHGSYFIRPEMLRDPPSPSPVTDDDHGTTLDRLRQTRHYLEYALALAHLARRAEDCILRPGPVSPSQAADLCAELDTLDHNLSFYQLLGSAGSRSEGRDSPSSGRSTWPGGEGSEHLARRTPQVQKMHLSLELGLIRFKLFRHETFHLLHEASTAAPLRLMCLDACMDACILVLAQCRRLGNGDGIVDQVPDIFEVAKRPCTGSLRRVLQPASAAALIGQVLLHESQSADGMGILARADHPPPPGREFFAFAGGAENNWASIARLSGEKVGVLQWHVNTVLSLLEAMQGTSSLARSKLSLHMQCM
ncbi:C6 finger domain protein [Penicillium verrucosum]|uniref:C6 finger domain protein n=1 Tax=Penicillium verrucosum TaxID=60171 RepID=UPI0025455A24|nr:C6 finger domain protein [Penicillium verrucosum]KAJ5941756.1 C6 finger domain protein [Penicillium verrucosum]